MNRCAGAFPGGSRRSRARGRGGAVHWEVARGLRGECRHSGFLRGLHGHFGSIEFLEAISNPKQRLPQGTLSENASNNSTFYMDYVAVLGLWGEMQTCFLFFVCVFFDFGKFCVFLFFPPGIFRFLLDFFFDFEEFLVFGSLRANSLLIFRRFWLECRKT